MGLELVIDERNKVRADTYNYILERYDEVENKKTGEKSFKWKDVGYFTLLEHALKKYVSEEIKNENKLNISELLVKLKALDEKIDRVVKKENIVLVIKDKNSKQVEVE